MVSETHRSDDSIFFVSLPKSGTVYTWSCLESVTSLVMPKFNEMAGWETYTAGYDFSCPEIYACGDYNTQLLLPHRIKDFVTGYVFGTHMQASYHNLRALRENGIDRLSVLIRDPRDAFVSWVHHLRALGPGSRNYHTRIYHIPTEYYDWSLAEQFAFQLRSFLPVTINWVEGWIDKYAHNDSGLEIKLFYYDELKTNPVRYIKRLLTFHGVETYDLSKVIIPEEGKLHFRRGVHGEWESEFSPEDRALSDRLLGSRLIQLFERAEASHLSYEEARGFRGRDPIASARAALEAVRDFPNFRSAYDLLIEGCATLGVSVEELSKRLDHEIQDTVEARFLYRADLIDLCEDLVARAERQLSFRG